MSDSDEGRPDSPDGSRDGEPTPALDDGGEPRPTLKRVASAAVLDPADEGKRPRHASDARRPVQTRAREPRHLASTAAPVETAAPPLGPRRRQPSGSIEVDRTPQSQYRRLDDVAAVPSPAPSPRRSNHKPPHKK